MLKSRPFTNNQLPMNHLTTHKHRVSSIKNLVIYVPIRHSTIVENPLQIGQNMQNKAKVKIGKMNISVATIKDYDKNNEQSATNVTQNKAKQSQS